MAMRYFLALGKAAWVWVAPLEKEPFFKVVLQLQLTIGFQAGGQKYAEVIFFQDAEKYKDFISGNFEFAAQVSAVALTSGVSADAKYENGILVVTMAIGGLMYEASIGGQKFKVEEF